MGRYITPLPGVLASVVEFVLERACSLDANAPKLLAPLENRWLKFDLQGLGIELWISASDDRFRVRAEADDTQQQATTTISGTPAALLGMAVPALSAAASGVRIEGDAQLGQQFQQVMKALDPDLELALSEYFGEFFGPQMYRLVKQTTEFTRNAADASGEQFSRWLREESALVPAPGEWQAFSEQVDRLREAVDRLERRARRAGI